MCCLTSLLTEARYNERARLTPRNLERFEKVTVKRRWPFNLQAKRALQRGVGEKQFDRELQETLPQMGSLKGVGSRDHLRSSFNRDRAILSRISRWAGVREHSGRDPSRPMVGACLHGVGSLLGSRGGVGKPLAKRFRKRSIREDRSK